MKVCVKENEFNPSFILLYGEEKAIEQGYTIFEVPQGYEDCAFEDFDNNGFNTELYNKRKQSYKNRQKLNELTNWFNNYFDKQLTQSMWQSDFTVSADPYFKDENGKAKTYASIDELKAQAEIVRQEIKQLKENL